MQFKHCNYVFLSDSDPLQNINTGTFATKNLVRIKKMSKKW